MSSSSTDRIEKTIVLAAPIARVWRALTNEEEFGSWFVVKLADRFRPGAPAQGRITSPGYEHVTMRITVEEMEPLRTFSFRWHPAAIDPAVDYSTEPTTLVVFRLEEVREGTRLTVVESGFDAIPLERRALAFRLNDQGWAAQLLSIERHVGTPS
jgi:uncharacterized protein YndB with AHSA1/START domain